MPFLGKFGKEIGRVAKQVVGHSNQTVVTSVVEQPMVISNPNVTIIQDSFEASSEKEMQDLLTSKGIISENNSIISQLCFQSFHTASQMTYKLFLPSNGRACIEVVVVTIVPKGSSVKVSIQKIASTVNVSASTTIQLQKRVSNIARDSTSYATESRSRGLNCAEQGTLYSYLLDNLLKYCQTNNINLILPAKIMESCQDQPQFI